MGLVKRDRHSYREAFMNLLLFIAWILLAFSCGVLGLWCVITVRLKLLLSRQPTVRAGLDLPEPEGSGGGSGGGSGSGGWPKLSIIVPAHNEQRVIDVCATALRKQNYPDFEIIFVLDRCTDETARIIAAHAAADSRIKVIENEACPEDWAGKCHAARIGAEQAVGEWLLFTDADTEFDPDLARAAVALAGEQQASLLSLLTTLTCKHWFERIVQPLASMTLVQLFPPGRSELGKRARPFANGQFLLFARTWYETVGGHEAVKNDLLEDLAFARAVYHKGGVVCSFFSDGMLGCSMYGSYADFRNGWKRIFIEACKRRTGQLRKYGLQSIGAGVLAPGIQIATVIVAGGIWTIDMPLAIAMGSVVLAGWIVQGLCLRTIYGLCGAPRWAVITYPWGSWIVGRMMLHAASDLKHRRPIRWGGREYVLEERK